MEESALLAEVLTTAFEADFRQANADYMNLADTPENRTTLLSVANPIVRNLLEQFSAKQQELQYKYDNLIISRRPSSFSKGAKSAPPVEIPRENQKTMIQYSLAESALNELKKEIGTLSKEHSDLLSLYNSLSSGH